MKSKFLIPGRLHRWLTHNRIRKLCYRQRILTEIASCVDGNWCYWRQSWVPRNGSNIPNNRRHSEYVVERRWSLKYKLRIKNCIWMCMKWNYFDHRRNRGGGSKDKVSLTRFIFVVFELRLDQEKSVRLEDLVSCQRRWDFHVKPRSTFFEFLEPSNQQFFYKFNY